MYKLLATKSFDEFKVMVEANGQEGWRVHSWQDSGGNEGVFIILILVKEEVHD